MPKNPARRACGGDVEGMEKIDMTGALPGEALSVVSASFDPGYTLEESLSSGAMTVADMKRGYSSYGPGVGEGKKDWRKS